MIKIDYCYSIAINVFPEYITPFMLLSVWYSIAVVLLGLL